MFSKPVSLFVRYTSYIEFLIMNAILFLLVFGLIPWTTSKVWNNLECEYHKNKTYLLHPSPNTFLKYLIYSISKNVSFPSCEKHYHKKWVLQMLHGELDPKSSKVFVTAFLWLVYVISPFIHSSCLSKLFQTTV